MTSPRFLKHGLSIVAFIVVLALLTACGSGKLPGGAACWEGGSVDLVDLYCAATDESTISASASHGEGVTTETYCLDAGTDGCDTGLDYICITAVAEWSKLGACIQKTIAAPALWAAAVCEPNDGFSDDGWLTLDSDANLLPYDTVLYVAADPLGPWYPTEFLQPPYVMSQTHASGLTDWMGLSDYHDLWFRASQAGSPANLGSMIIDREGQLGVLCGTE